MGGKKRGKNFTRNKRISRAKNDGKKSSGKSAKTRFFYKHTNIVTKKWGEKTREKFFSRNTRISLQKRLKKIDWKQCEITVFINTRISRSNNGRKNTLEKNFQKTHE